MPEQKQKKILLLHLFSNGDCLYVTAIARQIKQDFPGCSLTWAIAGFCKAIIHNNPFVDEVWEVNDVPRNDIPAFRKLKAKVREDQKRGIWDEVFVTLNMDENQAYYDGCIRTGIFHAYPRPILVDKQPVLRLTGTERNRAAAFAEEHRLGTYRYKVIFEFAPQSGQLAITQDIAIKIAERLTQNPEVAVILSSANKISHPHSAIIDGSVLTLRETAALTSHCTHLLGCSSGITWVTTADEASLLPMVQIVDPYTPWLNAVSRDFKRLGKATDGIIDIIDFDIDKINDCMQLCFTDFAGARKRYNQEIPLCFITTKKIIYNLITRFQFRYVATHIRLNRQAFGNQPLLNKAIAEAILLFPFTLIGNVLRKRLGRKSTHKN